MQGPFSAGWSRRTHKKSTARDPRRPTDSWRQYKYQPARIPIDSESYTLSYDYKEQMTASYSTPSAPVPFPLRAGSSLNPQISSATNAASNSNVTIFVIMLTAKNSWRGWHSQFFC